MFGFDVFIIDGFDCLMDIFGKLYDWLNKKKWGLNICYLMIKLNENCCKLIKRFYDIFKK